MKTKRHENILKDYDKFKKLQLERNKLKELEIQETKRIILDNKLTFNIKKYI